MRLDTSMTQRLDQKMILAPRMIQSMEILQLPCMALQERIEQELEDNPVLEQQENGQEEDGSQTVDDDIEPASVAEEAPIDDPERVLDLDGNEKDFDRLLAINDDWSDHFNEEHRPSSNRIDDAMDKKHDAMINMASRPQSLQDYLLDQLSFLDAQGREPEILQAIVAHIDERGYLVTPLEDVAKTLEPPPALAEMEAALARFQKLDPPGVGARTQEECLLLQLTPETPHREAVHALIVNHIDDITHNRLPVIQKRTGFDLDTIHAAIEVLKHLNPKPGASFTTDNIPYVVPDIAIDKNESGDYEVKLLDDWMPNIYISRRLIELYRDKSADAQTKEFLKRKIQSAQWLIEAIEQRRNTVTKVTRAIIEHQKAFLDKGPEFIEPLKMQQIADQVGVHVTTVSRAVDDKWVQTPRGIFPLKRFFGGGTHTSTGAEVAWETIKQKLLEIIGTEDKNNPLSDEDLVKKLEESGYPIARRTITKYRKMLNIASSRQRKVWSE